jgi:hypothetical protein
MKWATGNRRHASFNDRASATKDVPGKPVLQFFRHHARPQCIYENSMNYTGFSEQLWTNNSGRTVRCPCLLSPRWRLDWCCTRRTVRIREIAVELLLTGITFGILALPIYGQSKSRSGCNGLYGKTGRTLPSVLRQAIAVLPQAEFPISPDEVVLIRDINGFLDCLGVADPAVRKIVADYRAMVFNNHFPIYVNGSLPDTKLAIESFDRGRGSDLPYQFASFLAHEWVHANGEARESPAFAAELSILERFRHSLSAEFNEDRQRLQTEIKEAQEVEKEGRNFIETNRASKAIRRQPHPSHP